MVRQSATYLSSTAPRATSASAQDATLPVVYHSDLCTSWRTGLTAFTEHLRRARMSTYHSPHKTSLDHRYQSSHHHSSLNRLCQKLSFLCVSVPRTQHGACLLENSQLEGQSARRHAYKVQRILLTNDQDFVIRSAWYSIRRNQFSVPQ